MEKIFPLDPGTTSVDVSEIEIVAVFDDDDNSDCSIIARKNGNEVTLCGDGCQYCEGLLEDGNRVFVLEEINGEFQVVLNGPGSMGLIICPHPCPVRGLF